MLKGLTTWVHVLIQLGSITREISNGSPRSSVIKVLGWTETIYTICKLGGLINWSIWKPQVPVKLDW